MTNIPKKPEKEKCDWADLPGGCLACSDSYSCAIRRCNNTIDEYETYNKATNLSVGEIEEICYIVFPGAKGKMRMKTLAQAIFDAQEEKRMVNYARTHMSRKL